MYRQPSLHDAEQDSTPLRHFVFYGTAKRMKRRAFWSGVVLGGLITGASFIAGAAFAEPSHDWGGSSATLAHGEGDAIAQVECVNRLTKGRDTFLHFTLDLDGLSVAVTVEQGGGDIPDRYTVTPPAGYVAVPPSVTVAENDSATILIFLSDGGMS